MISRFMGMKSSSIREDSALAWMQCSFLILLQSKRERARWILEQERESFQSFWKQRQKGNILLGWRSRKKVRIWRKEVWHTIIWSRR